MTAAPQKMTFHVEALRMDSRSSVARCKKAEIVLDTDESEQRLALLHQNVKNYGTVFNTVAPGTGLSGVLRRKLA